MCPVQPAKLLKQQPLYVTKLYFIQIAFYVSWLVETVDYYLNHNHNSDECKMHRFKQDQSLYVGKQKSCFFCQM